MNSFNNNTHSQAISLTPEIFELELRISEIFYSIQGEGTRSGKPCVFIRLHGCMLRCTWCDTPYALDLKQGGEIMKLNAIIEKTLSFGCNFIEFTGGEPLAQNNIIPLIKYFCDLDKTVAIETNGHSSIELIDKRAIIIMDIKCPGSGMSKFNNYDNIHHLTSKDEVKFVIGSDDDFYWSKELIDKYNLSDKVGTVLLSPVFGKYEPVRLANLILMEGLDARLQLQIHKFIWEPDKRGV